ncbi:MAG: PKD domain-containing protein [candidate division FCPU426 bacterium]
MPKPERKKTTPKTVKKTVKKTASPPTLRALLGQRPRFQALEAEESATHPAVLKRQQAQLDKYLKQVEAQLLSVKAKARNLAPGDSSAAAKKTRSEQKQTATSAAEAMLDQARLDAKGNQWEFCRNHARLAISLREQEGLKPSSQAYGLVALSMFMLEGNTPAVRSYLLEAIDKHVDTPGLRSMLARYQLLVGDYDGARRSLNDARPANHPKIEYLRRIVEADAGGAWNRYPCNFYTYRNALIESSQINALRVDIQAMTAAQLAALNVSAEARDRALQALECHQAWNAANEAFASKNYISAIKWYQAAGDKITAYFTARYATADPANLLHYNQHWKVGEEYYLSDPWLITHFRDRYRAVTLQELYEIDWVKPKRCPAGYDIYGNAEEMLKAFGGWMGKWKEKVEGPLAVMLYALVPLAIAEAGVVRRRFEDSDEAPGLGIQTGALASIKQALATHSDHRSLCEFIERPFATILKARILMLKADFQYKARVADESPLRVDGQPAYQGLKAAKLYQGVIDAFYDAGYARYAENLKTAALQLHDTVEALRPLALDAAVVELAQRVPNTVLVAPADLDQKRLALHQLGHDPRIPTVKSANANLPGLSTRRATYEKLITFDANGRLPRESNPVIYALIAEAKARLRQLEAGLNWLGYSDQYVPPWRFQYLLERARYFASHAGQVQSLYLNSLNIAEKEELQEKTAGQNVVIEQANVNVETAKLRQTNLQFAAAQASTQLATLVAQNAQQRLMNYRAFDQEMDRLTDDYLSHVTSQAVLNGIETTAMGASSGASSGGWIGAIVGGVLGLAKGIWSGVDQVEMQRISLEMQNQQRELEKRNLGLAIHEADRAATVAKAQEKVAAAGVEVATLQRVVALMRHDFALQTLEYLKNRTLTAELWYRLADAIRGVAETYLRHGIELAFLAEQAYEFEANHRVDVIRFDYDMQQLGDFLAGDFLLRDLDSLEQSLITGETLRRQRLKYTVSLTRDFPDALQQLRENGWCVLPLTLLPLERRFPGMYNLRVSSVEVKPVALMDPTRFALHLTNLGASSIRLQADKTAPQDPFSQSDGPSWAAAGDATLDRDWPVKVRVAGAETEVYTGVSRLEDTAQDAFFSANQRAAFEGAGAASSWRLDMSMKENRTDPATLADVVLTFQFSGYYSDELKTRILRCLPSRQTQTLLLSGRQQFPDEFYEFQNTGRMAWSVDSRFVPAGLRAGRLRNLGLILPPGANRPHFGRILATQIVRVNVSAQNGALSRLTPSPGLSFQISRLQVTAQAVFDQPVSQVTWNFGDDPAWQQAAAPAFEFQHAYLKPGSYTVTLRAAAGGRLYTYTARLAVAADRDLAPPLTHQMTIVLAPPQRQPGPGSGVVCFRVDAALPAGAQALLMVTANGRVYRGSGSCYVYLPEGQETEMRCTVVRELQVEFSGTQCFNPAAPAVAVAGLRAATNRQFDDQGALQPGALNAWGTRVFSGGECSPLDVWRADVTPAANPFLQVVDEWGRETLDLAELADAVLSLEYEAENL